MKTLLLLSIFSLSEIAFAQHSGDTVINYICYPGSPYKIKSERHTRTFNARNNIATRKMEKWDRKRKVWHAASRDAFTYNEQGYLTKKDEYVLDSQGNDLRLFISETSKYDSLGNCVETLQTCNSPANILNNSWMSCYSFEGKNLMEERRMVWSFNNWQTNTIKTYNYDSSGNLILEIEKERNIHVNYPINYSKTVYSYHSDGTCKGSMVYHWDTIQNDWDFFLRKTCIYNVFGKDSVCIYERWKYASDGWDKIIFESFAYNDSGRKIMEKRQIMDKDLEEWIESSKSTWEYNAAGCVVLFEWCDEWNIEIKSYAVRQREEWFSRNCSIED